MVCVFKIQIVAQFQGAPKVYYCNIKKENKLSLIFIRKNMPFSEPWKRALNCIGMLFWWFDRLASAWSEETRHDVLALINPVTEFWNYCHCACSLSGYCRCFNIWWPDHSCCEYPRVSPVRKLQVNHSDTRMVHALNCWHFNVDEQDKLHACPSWTMDWKVF